MNDVRTFLQILVKQMNAVEGCPSFLLQDVVKNVRTAVLLFVSRVEALTDPEGLVFHVAAGPSQERVGQASRAHLLNARLFQLSNGFLASLLEHAVIAEVLSAPLQTHIKTVRDGYTAPFFQTLALQWEESFASAWRAELLQNRRGASREDAPSSSPTIGVFLGLCQQAGNAYLSHFQLPAPLAAASVARLAGFVLLKFLRRPGTFSLMQFNNAGSPGEDLSTTVLQQRETRPISGGRVHPVAEKSPATASSIVTIDSEVCQLLRLSAPARATVAADLRTLSHSLSGALLGTNVPTSSFNHEVLRGLAAALESGQYADILQLVEGEAHMIGASSGGIGATVVAFVRELNGGS